jgi:hypothetical protein
MAETRLTVSETVESRSPATDIFAMIGLFILAMMLYLPAFQFGFLNWDDPWYILNNDLIKNWSFSNLYQIATQPVARNYAPLTILSFLFDHTLWGEKAQGYHALNVFLHLVNGFLVYKLIVQLSGSRLVGWATAAFFIVHPLQVETVAWISSRKGLLSATFMLLSMYYWLRPETTGRQEAAGFAFFVAALLCKAIAIMVPPIVVVWHVLVYRRQFSVAVVRQFVPAVLAGLILLYTMSAQTTIVGGVRDHIGFSKAKILAIDAVIVWKYFGMLIWPQEQCVLYDPPTEGIGLQMVLSIGGLLAIGILTWRNRNRMPRVACAVVAFALLLLPVMNLFPITTLMNDRYLYLPSIPFFAVMTALTLEALRGLAHRVKLPAAGFAHCISALCVVAAVSGYSQRTVEYLPVWKNSLSLWTYATQKTPTLAVTWIQLALTHHALGHTDKAVATLHTAMGTCRMDVHDEHRVTEMLHKWTDHEEQSIPGTDKLNRNVDAALRTGMLPDPISPVSH